MQLKLALSSGEVFKKFYDFLRNNGATDVPTTFGRCFEKHEVNVWNWSEHIEDGYLRANYMHVRVSYLRGVVLLISVRSGAGWKPNDKDQKYILNYLKPLIDSLGIGDSEGIYTKSVGTRSGNANVLNLIWCDEDYKHLVAAIAHVFDE